MMARSMAHPIRVGIGGWTYAPWRGQFYPDDLPQRRELEYASRHVNSIEINGTYYGSQKRETFAKWHDETPDDFVFALKGPRFATNRRVLAEAGNSVSRFVDSGITALKDKLGPINWQLPPTKIFDADDIEAFLDLLPREVDGIPLRHAVEVRHPSFDDPAFIALAAAHGVAIVLAADSDFPRIETPTAPFVYARIMGATEVEPNGYQSKVLKEWAAQARKWQAGKSGRDVFLYFIRGFKAHNPAAAKALLSLL